METTKDLGCGKHTQDRVRCSIVPTFDFSEVSVVFPNEWNKFAFGAAHSFLSLFLRGAVWCWHQRDDRECTILTQHPLSFHHHLNQPWNLDPKMTGQQTRTTSLYLQFASFFGDESIEGKNENDGGNPRQRRRPELLNERNENGVKANEWMGREVLQKRLIPARGRRDKEQFRWEPARPHWNRPRNPWASECRQKPDSQSRPRCKSS